jgi:peptidyl-Asp metalloendopeptidase
MRQARRSFSLPIIAISVVAAAMVISAASGPARTQTLPRLFQGSFAPGASKPGMPRLTARSRRAKAVLSALNAPALSLNLFDNTEIAVTRTKVDRPRADRLVWHGRGDDGSQVALAVVKGALAGTVYTFGQTFDVVADGNGLYRVSELDSTAFPTEDPALDAVPQADARGSLPAGKTTVTPTTAADGVPQIDVMVVWTPAARNAVGGTQAGIESLIQSAVANANLAYSNSGVNAQLRLVHAEEVAFTEGSISTDLTSLSTAGDGVLDRVQTLRDQYGADVVTLLGNGYVAGGTCGSGFIMGTPTASFAAWAYNIVDQSCAAGYLSYAHEVGHNEGLQHDPANSNTAPAYPYAYGYQDPSGAFRTVMSYGSSQRVPFFSNPSVLYNGLPTGNTNQKNAVALNLTVPIVTQFRPAADGTVSGGSTPPPPPPCAYSVSPTSLSFSTAAGSATVTITTTSGCSWSSTSATAWVGALGTGSASGASKVTVLQNTGGSRSSSVTIAGKNVSVSQQGVKLARGGGKRK